MKNAGSKFYKRSIGVVNMWLNKNVCHFFCIVPLYFFIFSSLLIGCSKDNESQSREKSVGEIIAEDEKNNLSIPPIDPSVCENNPEGFLYFKFGDEVFRYTKDSPIKVGPIFPSSEFRLNRKVKDTTIPEGCEGNPYTGISLIYKHPGVKESIGNIELYKFWVYELAHERYSIVSPGQELRESFFYRLKSTGYCEDITENMEKCNFKKDGFSEAKNGSFMAKNGLNNTHFNRPFVVDCQTAIHIVCEVYYRLYPSIDIAYGFYVEKMEPKYFLEFDKYIRDILENMRVKN